MTEATYDGNKTGPVLKTDVLGRVKTGVRQRETILDEFERSGLSGTKFAAVAGVKYATLASWVQKRRRATGAYRGKVALPKPAGGEGAALPALGWVEALMDNKRTGASAGKGALRMELPGGASLEITNEFQAALAGQVLRAWHTGDRRASC